MSATGIASSGPRRDGFSTLSISPCHWIDGTLTPFTTPWSP